VIGLRVINDKKVIILQEGGCCQLCIFEEVTRFVSTGTTFSCNCGEDGRGAGLPGARPANTRLETREAHPHKATVQQ